jgi:hypothetical protein
MNPPGKYPGMPPTGAERRTAWFIAAITSGLVLLAGALTLDLHNQKRRLENLNELLTDTGSLREAENKSAEARLVTAQAALQRARDLSSEEESDFKKLAAMHTQREASVKQSVELQDKFTALAKDLLELAKTDPEAREIVRKYNISQ